MYCIQATIKANEKQGDALEQHLTELTKSSRGKTDCIHYSIYRKTYDADTFISIEHWQSKEAFKTHLSSPEIMLYQKETAELLNTVSIAPLYPVCPE